MNIYKVKREINPSVKWLRVEVGNIDIENGISMVIYFLDDAKNTVEKNVCVLTGDAYLNLGKGHNLKISILLNICQATGCKLIQD